MDEDKILDTALLNFREQTGLSAEQTGSGMSKVDLPDTAINLSINKKQYFFFVELRNELRELHIPELIDKHAQNGNENWLIVCQYLSKPNRALLKQEGINFLDASGNCYIHSGSLFIFINDRPVASQRRAESGKLWKQTGIRLVFALLENPDLINESYRNIAEESKVALGSIGILLKELQSRGYTTIANPRQSFLDNREALLLHWIEAYYSVMRPKLQEGKFRFVTSADRENWKNRKLNNAWWGGEPGGALLTKFLQPERFTVYSQMPKTELMKQLRMIPDPKGEVELLKPFWNTETETVKNKQTVPPLLVFAELSASMDSRNREIAMRIKQKYNV
ncbi:hypothetical protein BH11BAC7_BH11BAC7_15040 [soil metagenome]